MTSPIEPRRGSALAIVFLAIVVIGALLALSSDRVLGVSRLQDLSAAKQRAVYACEAVMAMKEAEIIDLAGANDIQGLQSRPAPNFGTHWIGGCLVRWRVEPAKVRTTADGSSGSFTVNPSTDTAAPGGAYVSNSEFYTYRIATEAVALRDGDDTAGLLDPDDADAAWQAANADRRLCMVQAQRLLQIQMIALFRYAVFYAAEGPDGDIEWFPGSGNATSVGGSVHSNGALYIANSGGVRIGGASSGLNAPVSCTAVGGFFRMYKMSNVSTGNGYQLDPLLIPPGDASTLNDAQATDNLHRINDVVPGADHLLTKFNDSRSMLPQYYGVAGITPNAFQTTFGNLVTDGVTLGARPVRTLSNIPELSGRPFLAQRQAPTGSLLFVKNAAGSPSDAANLALSGSAARQLYYTMRIPTGAAHVATRAAIEASLGSPIDQAYYAADGTLTTRAALEAAAGAAVGTLYYDNAGGIATQAALEAAHGAPLSELYTAVGGGIATRTALTAVAAAQVPAKSFQQYMQANVAVRPVAAIATMWPGLKVRAAVPVSAEGLPMHQQDLNGNGALDAAEMIESGDVTLPSGDVDADGFSIWERRGLYLGFARDGQGNGTVGLSIRERPAQVAATVAALPAATRPDPLAAAYCGEPGVYLEDAGRITMQAEGYSRALSLPQSTVQAAHPATGVNTAFAVGWKPRLTNAGFQNWTGAGIPAAYSYGGALVAWPDRGASFTTDVRSPTMAPHLTYRVRFATAGTWYVWMRGGRNSSTSGKVHVSLDTVADVVATAPTMLTMPAGVSDPLTFTGGPYGWRNLKASNTALTFTVAAGDVGTDLNLRVWMAEDGVILDKIVLSTAAAPTTASLDALVPVLDALPVAARDYEDDLCAWLRSQYAVRFGARDVTDTFFTNGAGTAVSHGDLMAYEAEIMNPREADYVKAEASGDDQGHLCNVLTLNLDRVLTWIRTGDYATIDASAVGLISARFNGLIFASRTRRSDGYHPVLRPAFAPGNFPGKWNGMTISAPLADNRPGSGPDMLFHSGFRLSRGSAIDWGGRNPNDRNRIVGLTFVTPNHAYLHGDFNIIPDPAVSDPALMPMTVDTATMRTLLNLPPAAGALSLADAQRLLFPPCAIYADTITCLSGAWVDAGQNRSGRTGASTDTYYNCSTILNNVPTDMWNTLIDQGSGGTHNVMRFIEAWNSGRGFHMRGSLVVLGRAAHSRGGLGSGGNFYNPPGRRDQRFDTDLLTTGGSPPFTPFGVNVARSISSVNQSTR